MRDFAPAIGGTPILALVQSATTHSHSTVHSLARLWEYVGYAATSIFTEEAAPLIGGLRSRTGQVHLVTVALSITGGTWSADILLYYLGRWRGEWVHNRWPAVRGLTLKVFSVVRRHPWRSSMAVRFAYGLRFTLPIACGAARVPLLLYVVGSGISAISWAFVFTVVGWGVGETALHVLGHVRRYEPWIMLAIVVGIAVTFLVMRRERVEDEVVEVLATGDEATPPAGAPRRTGY